MTITCEYCGVEVKYPVKDLLSLKANCTYCGASLSKVGKELRDNSIDANQYFLKVEVALNLEESFSITINDDLIEKINTIQDFVECVNGLLNPKALEREIYKNIYSTITTRGFEVYIGEDAETGFKNIVGRSWNQ